MALDDEEVPRNVPFQPAGDLLGIDGKNSRKWHPFPRLEFGIIA
jgi:hypothetical protein